MAWSIFLLVCWLKVPQGVTSFLVLGLERKPGCTAQDAQDILLGGYNNGVELITASTPGLVMLPINPGDNLEPIILHLEDKSFSRTPSIMFKYFKVMNKNYIKKLQSQPDMPLLEPVASKSVTTT